MHAPSKKKLWLAAAVIAVAISILTLGGTKSVFADAGNPILGTIKGTVVMNGDGTVTIFVRGQENWYTHGSDCNFDRAAFGVGIIWNDPTETAYTVSQGSISQGVGVKTQRPGDPNPVDGMVHPADVGNMAEGYPGASLTVTKRGVTTTTPQTFADPTPFASGAIPNSYATASETSWLGGCGREQMTSDDSPCNTAENGTPPGCVTAVSPSGLTCGDGTTLCINNGGKQEPWGSWGYSKNGGSGYSHTYASLRDISSVCVNFYDVHGGSNNDATKFQVPNSTNDLDVLKNSDNSIQTNAFNPAQGRNCVSFAAVTTQILDSGGNPTTSQPIGASVKDQITVTGNLGTPTGTVTVDIFSGTTSCGGTPTQTVGPFTLDASGKATTTPATVVPTGGLAFLAHYAGNTTPYGPAVGTCETLTATSTGQATVTSHPAVLDTGSSKIVASAGFNAQVPLGSTIYDTALIGGTPTPTGTVTFTLFGPFAPSHTINPATDCSGTPTFTSSAVTLDSSGAAAVPTGTGPTASGLGNYIWVASYSGDAHYPATADTCGAETQTTVDGRLTLSPLSADNIVTQPHTFTGQVQTSTDDVTWTSPSSGAAGSITLSLLNNTANAIFASGNVNPCTLSPTGSCAETVVAIKAGSVQLHGNATFTVTGILGTFGAVTGPGAGVGTVTNDAVKNYFQPATNLFAQAQSSGLTAGASGTVTYSVFTSNQCTPGSLVRSFTTAHFTGNLAPLSNFTTGALNGLEVSPTGATGTVTTYYFQAAFTADGSSTVPSTTTACTAGSVSITEP